MAIADSNQQLNDVKKGIQIYGQVKQISDLNKIKYATTLAKNNFLAIRVDENNLKIYFGMKIIELDELFLLEIAKKYIEDGKDPKEVEDRYNDILDDLENSLPKVKEEMGKNIPNLNFDLSYENKVLKFKFDIPVEKLKAL